MSGSGRAVLLKAGLLDGHLWWVMTLYLDNAATTFPKPAGVREAMVQALEELGGSPGRAGHRLAREASAAVFSCRVKVARLLGVSDPRRIVFTKNATEGINIVLKGWLRPGDGVIISGMEHNAVVRPLRRLSLAGVQVRTVPCDPRGEIDLEALAEELSKVPRLMVLNHASNVNGALQPLASVLELCRAKGVPLLLDAAQTAGIQPLDLEAWGVGMMACSGHKALLGPPGVGILYIRPDLDVLPLMDGGTGSRSEEDAQPDFFPDRHESGTLNLPGIAGLAAGIDFITDRGVSELCRHEIELARILEGGLEEMPGITVYKPGKRGTGAVSFNVAGMNPESVAHLLDELFQIAVRPGLHCAPLAHRTLMTFPEGTVRVSPGFSNSLEEMRSFLDSLGSLLSRRGQAPR
ncbi:MAG: aminotransferase class V-fold PLP-dependent enzyme [Deltaproteobacteria bacterium]|nr:aminotransferase class V-fold PLP-dependent enzyme [Deltaproteobacteria bacterium]